MAAGGGDDGLCRARLAEERRDLARGELPVGFSARPVKLPDGSSDIRKWRLGIKPKEGSAYKLPGAGATYNVELDFPADYPLVPPRARFAPPIFHTNVWPSGIVCLSLLLEQGHHAGMGHAGFWQASRSFADILNALAVFLDEPNPDSIANADACALLKRDERAYRAAVAADVASYPARLAAKVAAEKR